MYVSSTFNYQHTLTPQLEISIIHNPTKARSVSVTPMSTDDWEILVRTTPQVEPAIADLLTLPRNKMPTTSRTTYSANFVPPRRARRLMSGSWAGPRFAYESVGSNAKT